MRVVSTLIRASLRDVVGQSPFSHGNRTEEYYHWVDDCETDRGEK